MSPEARQKSVDAVECYLAAIQAIADTIAAVCPEIAPPYYEQLMRLRRRLGFDVTGAVLEESRGVLQRELADFALRAGKYNRALAEDFSRTLATLASNEDPESARNNSYFERLAKFADRMDEIARSGGPQTLAQQSGELRAFAETMERDSREAFTRLHQRMGEFQSKLLEAELLASIDPLTGLGNRREFDRQLASRTTSDCAFCVLLFDLDHFKEINDRYGHLCGDEILRQLAARLNGQVRTRDFVCRWGGDEFAVIMECSIANGYSRSLDMSQRLSGEYRVPLEDKQVGIHVAVSVGIAECIRGETAEQLFQRVDHSMYRQKNS